MPHASEHIGGLNRGLLANQKVRYRSDLNMYWTCPLLPHGPLFCIQRSNNFDCCLRFMVTRDPISRPEHHTQWSSIEIFLVTESPLFGSLLYWDLCKYVAQIPTVKGLTVLVTWKSQYPDCPWDGASWKRRQCYQRSNAICSLHPLKNYRSSYKHWDLAEQTRYPSHLSCPVKQ